MFLGMIAKLGKAIVSFVTSVRPFVCLSSRNNSDSTTGILIKFDIWKIFENLSRKYKSN